MSQTKNLVVNDLLKHDKNNVIETTYRFYEDALKSFENSSLIELPESHKKIKNIFISGVGGSCIVGDLLKTYLWNKSNIPVVVNRSSSLPTFVNEETLCIFISYSGNTVETLSCAKLAVERNCKSIFVTRGGKLKDLANSNNIFSLSLTTKQKMPREALGDMFFSILGVLKNIKELNINESEIKNTIFSIEKLRNEIDIRYSPDNWLFNFAKELDGKNVAMFGVTPSTETVALRWKNQFNENAKMMILSNSFPELTHNEIVGLMAPNTNMENYHFILVRDTKTEDKYLTFQINFTLDFFRTLGSVKIFEQDGDTLLERQIKLIYLGDYLSIYCSLLKGIDPTPIEAIDILKKKMESVNYD